MPETVNIATSSALRALPEGTRIIDATGREYVKDTSGKETVNLNWIAWVSAEGRVHSDGVYLPAIVQQEENHE